MNHYLFVGLGNPGTKYEKTRHNLGIHVMRAWVEQSNQHALSAKGWHTDQKFNADLAQLTFSDAIVTCLFPLTQMNKSGQAVHHFWRKRFSRLWRRQPLNHLIIIHDELEIPLGKIRYIQSGSARGHNGVRSIHQAFGSRDIPRLLLGIGPKPTTDISQYVLGTFSATDQEKIAHLMPSALEHLTNVTRQKKSSS